MVEVGREDGSSTTLLSSSSPDCAANVGRGRV